MYQMSLGDDWDGQMGTVSNWAVWVGCCDVESPSGYAILHPVATTIIAMEILLMEEILYHLGCINPVKNGINHQPQLVQDFFHQYDPHFLNWSSSKFPQPLPHLDWAGFLPPQTVQNIQNISTKHPNNKTNIPTNPGLKMFVTSGIKILAFKHPCNSQDTGRPKSCFRKWSRTPSLNLVLPAKHTSGCTEQHRLMIPKSAQLSSLMNVLRGGPKLIVIKNPLLVQLQGEYNINQYIYVMFSQRMVIYLVVWDSNRATPRYQQSLSCSIPGLQTTVFLKALRRHPWNLT